MIVIDASVVVELVLVTPDGWRLGARLFEREPGLCAPELVDVEVAQIVRHCQRQGEVSAERGEIAIADLAALPIERFVHRPLLARMWELRANLTAYDAAYVALAEALDAPLLTRDAKLARAARSVRAEVV